MLAFLNLNEFWDIHCSRVSSFMQILVGNFLNFWKTYHAYFLCDPDVSYIYNYKQLKSSSVVKYKNSNENCTKKDLIFSL